MGQKKEKSNARLLQLWLDSDLCFQLRARLRAGVEVLGPLMSAASKPGRNPNTPVVTVHSPHGDWEVGISLYPGDYLPAKTMVGHALRQIPVPLSQHEFVWYLTEEGRRLPEDENIYADRDRSFNLVMELA
jgi:hypothetical protein